MMVALILLKALVFRFASSVARELLLASAVGDPERRFDDGADIDGGLWDTQSCTRRETLGLEIKL